MTEPSFREDEIIEVPPEGLPLAPTFVEVKVRASAYLLTKDWKTPPPQFPIPVYSAGFDIDPFVVIGGIPKAVDLVNICEVTTRVGLGVTEWVHEPVWPEGVDLSDFSPLARWLPSEESYTPLGWTPFEGQAQYLTWVDHPAAEMPDLDTSYEYEYQGSRVNRPALCFSTNHALRLSSPLASTSFGGILVLVPGPGAGSGWTILSSYEETVDQAWLNLFYSHGEVHAQSTTNPACRLATTAWDRGVLIAVVQVVEDAIRLAVLDKGGSRETTAPVTGMLRPPPTVGDPEEGGEQPPPPPEEPFTFVLDLGKAGATGDARVSADMELLEVSLYGSETTWTELKSAAFRIMNSYGVIW